MIDALSALLPILLVTAVGWAIARFRVVPPEQWPGFEAIAYQVLFPSLIVAKLWSADFSRLPILSLGATLFLSVLTMAALLLVARPALKAPLRLDGPRFTSLLQGATRWNSFIGLAMAASLYGDEGLTLSAVAIVAMIPLLNFINVAALAWFAAPARPTIRSFAVDLATNPFIWSCALGIALNLLRIPAPEPVMTTLEMMGSAALPAGILAVGAGLDLKALRRPGPALTTATILRLAGMPLLAALFAGLFGVTGIALGVAIVATAVPTASGAYLLARKMGGDAKLMAEIITLQTLAAAITLPLAIGILA